MMFASNQTLEVSGCLNHKDELKNALEFALKASGTLEGFERDRNPVKCVYQITEDGRYCLGWAVENSNALTAWNEFPFDFDIDIISRIIAQHLEKQEIKRDMWDGSYHKGFIMKVIPEWLGEEHDGVNKPFYGIVEFAPYTCFYSK